MLKRVASETLRDQAERVVADAKAKVPLYFGHPRDGLAAKIMAIYGVSHAEIYGYFKYGTVIRRVHPSPVEVDMAMALGRCGKALRLADDGEWFVFDITRPLDWVADTAI